MFVFDLNNLVKISLISFQTITWSNLGPHHPKLPNQDFSELKIYEMTVKGGGGEGGGQDRTGLCVCVCIQCTGSVLMY